MSPAFGLLVLAAAVAGVAAVLSSRVSERLRIPAPAFFLVAAAAASDVWPRLGNPSSAAVEHVVSIALAVILFDGGMRLGWRRLRTAAVPALWLGVVGTLATAGGVASAAHLAFGMDWRVALVLGAALAPTDPAVVFSVLGRREAAGRGGALLEGESGSNDPVGIALLVALLAVSAPGASVAGRVAWELTSQLTIGAAAGTAGGLGLLAFMRRVPLPSEALYPLRVLTGALAVYGAATAAHGSGFLAVFIAGVILGDEKAPYKREIARFHASLASLAELVAFVMLGLTINLRSLADGWAWLTGLLLALLLAVVIRPLLAGLLLWPVRIPGNERLFVAWAGLKGAVPILLGALIVQAGITGAQRLYDIIFVVVAFSVIVQGGTVPWLARRLQVLQRVMEPEPWSLGIRFQHEPEGLHRFVVAPGSPADLTQVGDLHLASEAWVSLIIRDGRLVPAQADTVLQAGDEAVLLASDRDGRELGALFAGPADSRLARQVAARARDRPRRRVISSASPLRRPVILVAFPGKPDSRLGPDNGPARISTGPPSRLPPVCGRAWWTQGRCARGTEVHDGDAGPGPSRRP
jgi:potassium/hydrogen antiporter